MSCVRNSSFLGCREACAPSHYTLALSHQPPVGQMSGEPAAKKAKTGEVACTKATDGEPAQLAGGAAAAGVQQPATGGQQPATGGQALVRPAPPADPNDPEQAEVYYNQLVPYVKAQMCQGLAKYGVSITAVDMVAPAAIEDNAQSADGGNAQGKVTSFREEWRVDHCKQAIDTVGMYEGNGLLWWLQAQGKTVIWEGKQVLDNRVTWAQVQVAGANWSQQRFIASHQNFKLRRFIFPVTVPTACHGTPDVEQKIDIDGKEHPYFKNLPVLGGRPLVLAFYEAVADCLAADDALRSSNQPLAAPEDARLLKLWEATTPHPPTPPHVLIPTVFPRKHVVVRWVAFNGGGQCHQKQILE